MKLVFRYAVRLQQPSGRAERRLRPICFRSRPCRAVLIRGQCRLQYVSLCFRCAHISGLARQDPPANDNRSSRGFRQEHAADHIGLKCHAALSRRKHGIEPIHLERVRKADRGPRHLNVYGGASWCALPPATHQRSGGGFAVGTRPCSRAPWTVLNSMTSGMRPYRERLGSPLA